MVESCAANKIAWAVCTDSSSNSSNLIQWTVKMITQHGIKLERELKGVLQVRNHGK